MFYHLEGSLHFPVFVKKFRRIDLNEAQLLYASISGMLTLVESQHRLSIQSQNRFSSLGCDVCGSQLHSLIDVRESRESLGLSAISGSNPDSVCAAARIGFLGHRTDVYSYPVCLSCYNKYLSGRSLFIGSTFCLRYIPIPFKYVYKLVGMPMPRRKR